MKQLPLSNALGVIEQAKGMINELEAILPARKTRTFGSAWLPALSSWGNLRC